MKLQEYIKGYYIDVFQKAVVYVKENPETYNSPTVKKNPYDMFIHNIAGDICDLPISEIQKLELFFEIYEQIPVFTVLMYANTLKLSETAGEFFRKNIRKLLDDTDIYAEPVLYRLRCGPFEKDEIERKRVRDILVEDMPSEKYTQRILENSGPIDFDLKYELYNKLIENINFHKAIYKSLWGSRYDIYGDFDCIKTKEIVNKLPNIKEYKNSKMFLDDLYK